MVLEGSKVLLVGGVTHNMEYQFCIIETRFQNCIKAPV